MTAPEKSPYVAFGLSVFALAMKARTGRVWSAEVDSTVALGLRVAGDDVVVRAMLATFLETYRLSPRMAGEVLLESVLAWLGPLAPPVEAPLPDWTRRADCGHA